MSSFYDDASLVVIPSGYKTSKVYAEKPTDGSGDLAFTRTGDTATRVNSAGLIEEVRTNLILQSQTFDNASWGKDTTTVTANAEVAPDGTLTADTMTISTDASRVTQGPTIGAGSFTASVYVKIISQTTAGDVRFLGVVDGSVVNVNFTPTNQWARYTATFTASTQITSFQLRGATSGFVGTIAIWGFQLEASDFGATSYIPTTTAAVSVGPVANVPRLDYLGSTCGKLLLEPQRTNLVTYSEQFNNAAWVKSGNGVGVTPVVTANNGISPDGYQNADKIDLSLGGGATSSDWSWVYQTFTVTANQPQAISIYIKAATAGDVGKVITLGFISYVGHTLTADWTRVEINQTIGSTASYSIGFRLRGTEGTASTASLYAWGAQLEQNAAYSSSYIPTLAASATRGADACSKTGISSLIGQTQGTLFVDFTLNALANYGTPISVNDGSTTNYVWITIFANGNLRAELYNGAAQASISYSGAVNGSRYKMAFGYKTNDFVLYVNGAQVGTDNSGTTFSGTTLSRVDTDLTNASVYSTASESINQSLLFKTRLTNAELAELTTI